MNATDARILEALSLQPMTCSRISSVLSIALGTATSRLHGLMLQGLLTRYKAASGKTGRRPFMYRLAITSQPAKPQAAQDSCGVVNK